MQTLTWYVQRLKTMSPGEVAWRVKSAVRDVGDRYRVAFGVLPSFNGSGYPNAGQRFIPGFRVADVERGAWSAPSASAEEREWRERVVKRADVIAQHRLSFFNLRDHDLGHPIDWNRDHGRGKSVPLDFSPSIDYRDVGIAGDCKFVWEPNRHHHLVVLARAYRATGDSRYADAVVEQLDSWLTQCPFGRGMNWRSPLELAIRVINWVWTIDLIVGAPAVTAAFHERVRRAAGLHLWEITRKYSQGSSANNHLIGEAAGVFIGSAYFSDLPDAERWSAQSRAILIREIEHQTYADGCTREQAFGYHVFVMQFLLLAGLVGRWIGREFPAGYWSGLERMMDFSAALAEGGGSSPTFGDADDGYVLDLGEGGPNLGGWLATGAVLFQRADLKSGSGGYDEPVRWLLGRESRERFDAIAAQSARPLRSRAFVDSGYYLIQSGQAAERISVLFDCGELGFHSIAAHGHADALSFTLRAFGRDVLVDPGTFDYFSYRPWREYFRSTRAHNTVTIDGAEQSVPLGLFMWGERARPRCLSWEPTAEGGRIIAEHDGYRRLNDPVTHRRSLVLDGSTRTVTVRDEILAKDAHDVELFFHLSDQSMVTALVDNQCYIAVKGGGTVLLELDARLRLTTVTGGEDPIGGWVSPGYHRKAASTTIVGRGVIRGDTALESRIAIGEPLQGVGEEP